MPSAFLNAALDGTDLGYNKAIVDALMVVAQGGDRRTLAYSNPASYSYLGIQRATLPRTYLNTDTMPVRTGVVWNVTTDGELATALAGAVIGDWIVVALGTYTGIYVTPLRAGDAAPGGNGVIVIISKPVYDSMVANGGVATVLPQKLRVGPADYANMPHFKNVSLGNEHQWSFDGATTGYRLIGLRFDCDPSVVALSRLMRIGNGDPTLQSGAANAPRNIGIDRCAFDGNPTIDLKCALELHGRSSYVQDSYFGTEIHHRGSDCQAIRSYNGPGPFRIVNNTLIGSSENILFGGSYSTPGAAPQDVELRWNAITKPLTWNPSHPSYAGIDWSIKNLVETKKLQYGLFEGNYLARSWPDGQAGAAFLLKAESYGDQAQNGDTHDILVRWNLVEDVSFGANIAGVANVDPAAPVQNIWSVGNLYKLGGQYFDASVNPFLGTGLFNNCGSIHDTFIAKGNVNAIAQPEGGQTKLTFLDTIFGRTGYGLKGSGQTEGTATLVAFAPQYDVRRCVFTGRSSGLYPPNNFFPVDESAVGFTNYAGGDYSLAGSSQVIVPTEPPVTVPVLSGMQLVVAPSGGTSGLPLPTEPSIRMLDDVGLLFVMNGSATVAVLSGTATLTAGATIPITNGIGTASGLTLAAPAPTSVVLRITEPTSGLHVDTPAIAIDAPALTLTTPASDGVSGVALPTQPVLQYRDALGVPIARSGVVVTASVAGANGAITAGGTATTNGAGQATFSGLALAVASESDVTVRYATSGATPIDETVHLTVPAVDAVVTQLVPTRKASGAKNGDPFRIEPRYEWQNAAGQLVPDCTGFVSHSVIGNAELFGTTGLHAVGGVADFAGSGMGVSGRGKITLVATGTL